MCQAPLPVAAPTLRRRKLRINRVTSAPCVSSAKWLASLLLVEAVVEAAVRERADAPAAPMALRLVTVKLMCFHRSSGCNDERDRPAVEMPSHALFHALTA
jgi:hypothetical protein